MSLIHMELSCQDLIFFTVGMGAVSKMVWYPRLSAGFVIIIRS